jgi:hypothetical protein
MKGRICLYFVLELISTRVVDPDPYWESGSRGKKMKKFQWKNALFSYLKKKFLPLKRYKIALTTF